MSRSGPSTRQILRLFPILLLGYALVAPRANAADRTWNNAAGGNFLTATNWVGNLPASATDRAIFDLTSNTYTVTFSGSVATDKLLVDDSVIFDLGGLR